MNWIVILLVVAGLLGLLLANRKGGTGNAREYDASEASAPDELRQGRRIPMSGTLRMRRPFRLHGRPDHVYLTSRGTLVVREDKSSQRHLEAAIIQASVYAAILRHSPPPELANRRVEPYCWLRIGTPGKTPTRFVKAPLLDDRDLGRLVDTYRALSAGWNPTRTSDLSICRRRCPHFGNRCNGSEV